jgi:hypothetical protein
LKPCPFCGAEPTWLEWNEGSETNTWTLGCSAPGCLGCEAGPYGDKAACILQWNTRASLSAPEREWRPIESAPRDGTEIIAWREVSENSFTCKYIEGIWKFSGGVHMHSGPDGWMPLPPPPSQPK